MPRPFRLALLLCAAATGPAAAAPVTFTLAPGPVQVEFRAYGLGMIPITGHFVRFSGTLVLDDADPAACTLALTGEAASLTMGSEAMTADALGPDLLDVGHHPTFRLSGVCRGGALPATLLLHGVSGGVAMAVERRADRWVAQGSIDRRAWGMGARPLLAGSEVRLTVTAGLPGGAGK